MERKRPLFRWFASAILVLGTWLSAVAAAPISITWAPPSNPGRGQITITLDNYSKTIRYGEGTTATSLAGAIGAHLSLDLQSPVWAKGKIDGTVQMRLRQSAISNLSVCIVPDGTSGCSMPAGVQIAYDRTGILPALVQTSNLALTCTPNPAASGSHPVCTAQRTSGARGSVSFYLDGKPLGTSGLNSAGRASVTLGQTPKAGSHIVSAYYAGDSAHSPGSASSSLNVQIAIGSSPAKDTVLYSYSITDSNGDPGFSDNGNIVAFKDKVNGMWTASYDGLNRLIGATQKQSSGVPFLAFGSNDQQSFCWSYDNFGNRTAQAISDQAFTSGCSAAAGANYTGSTATYTAANRFDSVSGIPTQHVYDDSGNILDDCYSEYIYDGDGRLCAARKKVTGQVTGYLYDAEGVRTAKGTLSSFSCDLTSNRFVMSNEYITGPSGGQLTELDGSGNLLHTNAYAENTLVATYDGTLALHFELSDWLGTRRVETAYNGYVEQNCSGGAFGDQTVCTGSGDATGPTQIHFTGKERDAESNLDHFKYRDYSNSMGRWMSPDPSGLTHADLRNPQSLNLYSYVGNNPLTRVDLDGLCWKGFGWACDLKERVDNLFHGLGFRTDQSVNNYVQKANQFLRRQGISTEGMKRSAILGLYGKTYQTYRRANLRGGPDYVGRTSGTGDPRENIAKRNSYKPKTGEYGPARLDKSSSNPDAIRGREQQLIEANGGAQSQGGTSGNAINGVSESNPNASAYKAAAQAEFGVEEGETALEGAVTTIEVMNEIPD